MKVGSHFLDLTTFYPSKFGGRNQEDRGQKGGANFTLTCYPKFVWLVLSIVTRGITPETVGIASICGSLSGLSVLVTP